MASIGTLLEQTETAISEIKRRPFDRFALGPFMVWYGLKSKEMGKWPRRAMVGGGLFQLLYAWNEYRRLLGAVTENPKSVFDVITNPAEADKTEVV